MYSLVLSDMTFRKLIFTFLLLSLLEHVHGQGSINIPTNECLGNLTNYTYTPPPGLALNTANWDFGDGYSSSNNSPSHTYSQTGIYKVKIQATFTNSSSRTDSTTITVHALPKAGYIQMKIRDTCLTRNRICYIDTSSPANGSQPIKQSLFVWGDGDFTVKTNPKKGDTMCHTYLVADIYNLKLEVTDVYGCKNSINTNVTILDNVAPAFIVDSKGFVDCNTYNYCLKNQSTGSVSSKTHYRWIINGTVVDTNGYLNTTHCFNFTKTQVAKVQLLAYNDNACRDTISRSLTVVIDSLPTYFTLLDTVKCFGDNSLNFAEARNVSRDYSRWYLNGGVVGIPPIETSTLSFDTKMTPVLQTIKYRIFRGSCYHDIDRTFNVIGPIARIRPFDYSQCETNRTVYLINNSGYADSSKLKFHWYIDDSDGDSCVNYRAKGINLYKNCIESLDWYTKYTFKKGSGPKSISFTVQDTVTGCKDSIYMMASMMDCPKILNIDTFTVCQGDMFLEEFPQPGPKYFSVDTGKTWKKFPQAMNKPYEGYYGVGFIFETIIPKWVQNYGNDSIKIRTDTIYVYDTIFRKQLMHVVPPKKDSISILVTEKCSPFKVEVRFDTGKFYKKEKLQVIWGDVGNVDIEFKRDTVIKSETHYYRMGGVSGEIQVFITDSFGCVNRVKYPLEIGKAMSFYTPNFINCKNGDVCFTPGVFDFNSRKYWSGNTANNKVSWIFPDTPGVVNNFSPCVKYKNGGMQVFRMIVSDSLGCKDTIRDSIFIQDVRANFKNTATTIYCSELKQFFDSSSFLTNPKWRYVYPTDYRDSIVKYAWQFGNGTFSSLVKNPLQSLNTSMDKIPAAHMVQTASGCTDTIHFDIHVIGPKPYFFIRDTLGCGKLDAVFVNKSRNSKLYVWEFGDSAQSTSNTSSMNDATFTYNKPGRYFISLVGIDTLFNPITGKKEFCQVRFPDKYFFKDTTRSVLVLPKLKTGITGPDTICPDIRFLLGSLSDPKYNGDRWYISDTSTLDTAAGSSWYHSFKKGGHYTVKLNPYYNDPLANKCKDSASKNIFVLDLNADFVVDPISKAPQFYFTNRSTPINANFTWNYGKNGFDETHDINGMVNYGNDSGRYKVCLIAKIPEGCVDTSCKYIFSDFISGFMLYNVFTPGNGDGKNDEFDVQIEGESAYRLQIYDRWGVLVYEADKDYELNSGGNWNGQFLNEGNDCPSGTYYYLLNYELRSEPGKKFTYEGTVTLIR